ncbi:hypothetical protein MAPG_02196 [Magnaporthiopsis poae ATCC 64411]|uniref:Uncharacterized protein n=1 Tax=Magnaporthiopsis poae (strain ATCC 64411 / 73-15) TaxID=644358 RepID=A0A0C4DQQ0_MAGP6|nr:hypothetical protein MAPG_02196 [Magnaporthiopsis poae ATCC 64411]
MPDVEEPDGTSPPSYSDACQPGQDIIPPATLVLDGQQIRKDAAPEDSPPLYTLSLSLSGVSAITTEVELSRIEPRRAGPGRERHIYGLRQMRMAVGHHERVPSESPHYYIQRASARVPGPAGVGVKKRRSLIPGRPAKNTAVPVDLSGKSSEFGIPTFHKKADALFANNGRKWTTCPQGEVVALMPDDKDASRHTLTVTVAMPRAQFEMLVALWCCHVWEFAVARAPKIHEGMDGVARKLRAARE